MISMCCAQSLSCVRFFLTPLSGPPGSSVYRESPDKNTEVGCYALFQGDLPNPGVSLRSSTLLVKSLLFGPPGKSKNIGVGNLSLLPGGLPTQESHWGLLHCRRILYQLSYHRWPN